MDWFLRLQTQWNLLIGMGGSAYQGLRYDVAISMLREAGLSRRQRWEMLEALRSMEYAALPILNQS